MKVAKQRKFLWAAWITCFLISFNLSAYADSSTSSSSNDPQINNNTWHFLFAPYGWLPSVTGDIKVKNNLQNIHVPFTSILKNLDFAGEAHIEGGYGPLTLMVDPTYLKLTTDIHNPLIIPKVGFINTDIEATNETTLVDGGAFLRVLSSFDNMISLELLGGARYLGENNSFSFGRLPQLSVSSSSDFTSPIVGGRLKYDPNSRAHFWLRSDIGGFNVDHVNLTWSESFGFAYTIYPHIDLGGEYRALGINIAEKNSAVNIVINGPLVGIAFYY